MTTNPGGVTTEGLNFPRLFLVEGVKCGDRDNGAEGMDESATRLVGRLFCL
jgi:hypothetical protein